MQNFQKNKNQIHSKSYWNINERIDLLLTAIQTKYAELIAKEITLINEEKERVREYIGKSTISDEEQEFTASYVIKNNLSVKFYSDRINIENSDYFISQENSQSLFRVIYAKYKAQGIELLVNNQILEFVSATPIVPVSTDFSVVPDSNNLLSMVDNSILKQKMWKLFILRREEKALILLESRDQHGRIIESVNENLSEYRYGLSSIIERENVFKKFVEEDYTGKCHFSSMEIDESQKFDLIALVKRTIAGEFAFEEKGNDSGGNRYKNLIWHILGSEVYYKLHLDERFEQFKAHNRKLFHNVLLGISYEEASRLKLIEHGGQLEDHRIELIDHSTRLNDHDERLQTLEQELQHKIENYTAVEIKKLKKEIEKLRLELNRELEESKKQQNEDNEINQETLEQINLTIEQQQKRIEELEQKCKEFPKIQELSARYEQTLLDMKAQLTEQKKKFLAIDIIEDDLKEYKAKTKELESRIMSAVSKDIEQSQSKQELIELKIAAAERQHILESIQSVIEKHSSQLKPLVEEWQRNQNQEQLIQSIYQDPYQNSFYKYLVQQLNAIWLAAAVVNTDIVDCQKKGMISNVGNAVKLISNYVPVIGIAVQLCGMLLVQLDKNLQHEMLGRLYNLVSSPDEMNKLAQELAMNLINDIGDNRLDIPKLEKPKTLADKLKNILGVVINNIEKMVNFANSNEQDQEITLLTKTGKLLIIAAKDVLKRTNEATRQESIRTLLANEGKKHAGIVATIIIAKIYKGEAHLATTANSENEKAKLLEELILDEYGIIDNNVGDYAASIARLILEKSIEGRAVSHNKFIERRALLENEMSDILLSKQYYRILLDNAAKDKDLEEWIVLQIYKSLEKIGKIFKVYEEGNINKIKINKGVKSFIPDVKKIIAETMEEAIHEPNQQVWSIQTTYHNILLNHGEILTKAYKIAGMKAVNLIIELGMDKEAAEQILLAVDDIGVEKVLEIFFSPVKSNDLQTIKQPHDEATLETIAKIETIIGKDALTEITGWYKYVSAALSNNQFSASATKVIHIIGKLVNNLEEWLDFGIAYENIDVENQITIILSQLEHWFDFVASGTTFVGLPPRYPGFDPDDEPNGGSGNGGQGLIYRGGDGNQNEPVVTFFVGLNTTDMLDS